MSQPQTDRVRMNFLISRKQGTSVEDFQKYWRDEHARVFTSIDIVKKNVLKYEQVHINEEAATRMKQLGIPVAEFDGIAVIEGPSFEKIIEVFRSTEYIKVVIPDEQKFIDRSRSTAFPSDLVSVLGG